MRTLWNILAILVFLVIGTFLTGGSLWLAKRAEEPNKWPKTKGVVQQMKVKTEYKNGKTRYGYDLKYQYEVEGKTYIGTQITRDSSGGMSLNDGYVRSMAKRFPTSSEVIVSYNPKDHQEAVLQFSDAPLYYALAFFTGVGSLVAIVLTLRKM